MFALEIRDQPTLARTRRDAHDVSVGMPADHLARQVE
jgi:hypothetical protein